MSLIIGFTGKKKHGKSAFADLLAKRYNGFMCNFKDPLYQMAYNIGWNGVKDAKGRRLLQLLGTEVVRECIDENYWVKKWRTSISDRQIMFPRNIITVDDVRFDNEAKAVKDLGGIIVLVRTPSQEAASKLDSDEIEAHASEAGIDGKYIDYAFNLNFGMEHIAKAVYELVNVLKGTDHYTYFE